MRKIVTALLLSFSVGCVKTLPAPNAPDPYAGVQFDLGYSNGLKFGEKSQYYHADEGIYYLPTDVLLSLKRPIGDGLGLYEEAFFKRPERFGLYPDLITPNELPVGITISTDSKFVPMAGLNCSTCHTNVIIGENSTAFFVDGSSSMFAIDRFIKEMVMSIASTLFSPSEFSQFYKKYQFRTGMRAGSNSVDTEKDKLDKVTDSSEYDKLSESLKNHLEGKTSNIDSELNQFGIYLSKVNPRTGGGIPDTTLESAVYPTSQELDSSLKMFGYLFRRFVFFYKQAQFAENAPGVTTVNSGLGRSNPWSVTKNMLAANLYGKDREEWSKEGGGPVNTPSIWGFDRQKWIFWSGVTNSMLERNLAQGIALVTDFNWETYETTVSIKKLEHVSSFTRKVKPPLWPEHILGPINYDKANKGNVIFKEKCLNCHDPKLEFTDPGSAEFNYINVGTDSEYTKGQVFPFYGKDLFKDGLAPFLDKVKDGVYKKEAISDRNFYEFGRVPSVWKAPTGNKIIAKPLFGIWASAPYLHNGSVLSIRELLTSPAERLKKFYVGSMFYNSQDLGFSNTETWYSSVLDTSLVGNSSQGHDFGTDLSLEQKDELIEFLKVYTVDSTF